jgi:PBP1b-binding outer membrane lipoprotein LpoB
MKKMILIGEGAILTLYLCFFGGCCGKTNSACNAKPKEAITSDTQKQQTTDKPTVKQTQPDSKKQEQEDANLKFTEWEPLF